MWRFSSLISVVLLCSAALAVAQRSSNRTSLWQTLSGDAPIVIARGGFSGLFPDSSFNAYSFALTTSLRDVALWCDVQLTSDGAGICLPDIRLDNSSNIAVVYSNRRNTYVVNGVRTQGWFSVDFTYDELQNVYLTQGVYSRSNEFDHSMLQILTVEDVARQLRPPGFWLNVQHDIFFSQHNLSMRSYVIAASRSVVVNYISSPEVNFLRSIVARFKPGPTKLVFRFLERDYIEPSTNQTYGSLLRNLTFFKTFASGIMVPKTFIWPMNDSLYLQPHTSIVADAHKEGLEIFASDFANDVPFAYDYSYDPVSEYLSFIDNGNFSVDGVLSDFPISPSEAIDCFSHIGRNGPVQANITIISHEGASGDYPGCTDLAYKNAISDGADILDCPVQMTKDGIPFCLGSINLNDRTAIAQTNFSNRMMSIPQLKVVNGILSFNLTWSEVQNLTPAIWNPLSDSRLYRNPNFRNKGKLVSLSDFLALANNASSVSGVLIGIENAAYLAEEQGLGVTDAVLDALDKAGFNNQTAKKVMIESTNSSVLMKFKEKSNYERVYEVDENIRDALNSTIMDIKKFANSVVISKASVFPRNIGFLTGVTDVVPKLQAFDLPVYIQLFSNEFLFQAWDFFSDANVEMNSFVMATGINGVITVFPKTASKYRRNTCLGLGDQTPVYMAPVEPGSLFQLIQPQPPAQAPNPVLTGSDVVEPPLPGVVLIPPPTDAANGSTAAPPGPPSDQPKVAARIFLCNLAILLATLLLF
ncbi:hypothetical protein LguiA_023363 [Lonicera macranthoides]